MPSLETCEQNPADAAWWPDPAVADEMTGAYVSRGGSGPVGTAASSKASLLAATALGLSVAATHDPIAVLEGLTAGDLTALDDARLYVCTLQITDEATRQAAARLLVATAEHLRPPPSRTA
jgi:hypothetical protein